MCTTGEERDTPHTLKLQFMLIQVSSLSAYSTNWDRDPSRLFFSNLCSYAAAACFWEFQKDKFEFQIDFQWMLMSSIYMKMATEWETLSWFRWSMCGENFTWLTFVTTKPKLYRNFPSFRNCIIVLPYFRWRIIFKGLKWVEGESDSSYERWKWWKISSSNVRKIFLVISPDILDWKHSTPCLFCANSLHRKINKITKISETFRISNPRRLLLLIHMALCCVNNHDWLLFNFDSEFSLSKSLLFRRDLITQKLSAMIC